MLYIALQNTTRTDYITQSFMTLNTRFYSTHGYYSLRDGEWLWIDLYMCYSVFCFYLPYLWPISTYSCKHSHSHIHTPTKAQTLGCRLWAESTIQLEDQYHWNHFLSETVFLNNKNMGMGKYEQSHCNVNITIQGKFVHFGNFMFSGNSFV